MGAGELFSYQEPITDIGRFIQHGGFYSLLGVSESPTVEEIEAAFKKKALEYHPDQSREPGAHNKFIQIKEAREYLLSMHHDPSGFQPRAADSSGLSVDEAFPFTSYLPYQEEILNEAAEALFNTRRPPIVVIDAPPGIGKSGINIALGRLADSAFYTTPQKKLREQLGRDDSLAGHHAVLKARSDYRCDPGTAVLADQGRNETATCHSCPIYQDEDDRSCFEAGCAYWNAKEAAFRSHIATLTFAYLIIDGRVPTYISTDNGVGRQVSFADRDLLIVDEAHALEEQVASLHVGFSISPYTVPDSVYDRFHRNLESVTQDPEAVGIEELISDEWAVDRGVEGSPISILYEQAVANIHTIEQRLRVGDFVDRDELISTKTDLESLIHKLDYMMVQIQAESPWVASVDTFSHNDRTSYRAQLKPVYVDDFLRRFVWNRANKIVLSSATVPFRDRPEEWLSRLGLEDVPVHFISKPMPFEASNRPIYTDTIVDTFSGGGFDDNFEAIVDTIDMLAQRHVGEKGLIHTASYDRAERLHEALATKTVLHEKDGKPVEATLNRWQDGAADVLLSPSMMEGVDLPDDQCRWQVLAKVPYLNSYVDPRVDHLINEENDWDWYFEATARKVVQSVGRAVRHNGDQAVYYVFDESFNDVISRSSVPKWFKEAISSRSGWPRLKDQ
jgi:Rad3-related DNA helicase